MIEFAIIGLLLLMITVGLIDVGRGFYAYIQMSSAARFAARWAAVQGGTCGDSNTPSESTGDWCNGLGGSTSTVFWAQTGNVPLQGSSTCPRSWDSTWSHYYYASDASTSTTYPTVISTLERRMDTSSSSSSSQVGNWLAGLDPSQLRACIEISSDAYDSTRTPVWEPVQGDWVTVFVYYHFVPAGGLLGKALSMDLVASSRYVVE